ncbi:MAG: hypothetical protein QXS85_00015 [Acidilobaceae archaeon]
MARELAPLVEVLAFFAASRNYGFVDRLGGALNEITATEAVIDALRDYYSQCVDRREKCVEVGGERIACPDVSPEELKRAVEAFIARIRGKPGDVIVRETRALALEALARKPEAMGRRC